VAADLPHIDRELADRLAGVEQIQDASSAARSTCPDASLSTTSISIPTRAFICRNAR
jgi:hypothetical protein